MKRWLVIWIVSLALVESSNAVIACKGRFLNPITDVCWECMLPITIGAAQVVPSVTALPDTINWPSPVCVCPTPDFPFIRIGLAVGFWEPFALAETVREPYCFVSLNGLSLPNVSLAPYGTGGNIKDYGKVKNSFYQVHWFQYPLLSLLKLFTNPFCKSWIDIDLAYMTELDPLWNNDELSNILTPEVVLFANPITQVSCVADCIAASVYLPLNAMFWCAGCSGSMYPLTGNVGAHYGLIQAAELLTERVTFRLHRAFLLPLTSTPVAGCFSVPAPVIVKDQYRTSVAYPIPQTVGPTCCQPYGRTTSIHQGGREFPYAGEDAVNLIFRKRNCCLSW